MNGWRFGEEVVAQRDLERVSDYRNGIKRLP
jgi:hypothetical protein